MSPNDDVSKVVERPDMDAIVPEMPFPFIVGRGRSGTTLLRAMFDSHPDMAIPPETHALGLLGENRELYEDRSGLDAERFLPFARKVWTKKWRLTDDEFPVDLCAGIDTLSGAARALFSAYAGRFGKRRYAEKTPANVLHIPALANLFPESCFIHIIRDGRDVTLSYLSVDFGVTSVGESAIYWKRDIEQGRRDGVRLGSSRYRELRYEDLVNEPEDALRDLCRFVDLPFDRAMLRYFERVRASQTWTPSTSHRRLSQPPAKTREWRNEMRAHDLAIFEALAGQTLERFGYARALITIPLRAQVGAALATIGADVRRVGRASSKRLRKLKKRSDRQRGRG